MHFRLAVESDRGLVESLWDYCFEHREDPFFQWYFNHFYQPENVLMGFEGDDMACLTHLNPYTLCLRGKAVDTSYIVGSPAQRRRWEIADGSPKRNEAPRSLYPHPHAQQGRFLPALWL